MIEELCITDESGNNMEQYKRIKAWLPDEQPREKLVQRGAEALSHAELLAILIHTGTKDCNAVEIAREVLSISDNNLLTLGKLSLEELTKIRGIGFKKAITLQAALELGKRRQTATALEKPRVRSSKDSFDLLNGFLLDQTVEWFYVIYLNTANRVVSIERLSQGGMTATVVDCRILFKRALQLSSVTHLILAHNHPSGNLQPSEQDKRLTERVQEGAKLLELKLLDHLILAQNNYFSFADEGLL